ncbi:anti-sigma factor [Aquipuribacter sp. SD81]|uniref:anti-sigma factor n=1 Tax=Aquipuribacter sp. SD81 TaxID=3127703 RepID=UPI0030168EC0
MNDDELERTLADALAPAPAAPSPERVAALRAAVEARRPGRRPAAWSSVPRRTRGVLALAAAAAVLVAAGAVGAALSDDDDVLARGEPEFTALLEADGGAVVDLSGALAPEGRIVEVDSEDLPELPRGEYYELWFVGPDDDLPGGPADRVSAGTFHPPYGGGPTYVVLHAAVDPALFPEAEITREVADGDPAPSRDVVARSGLRLVDG